MVNKPCCPNIISCTKVKTATQKTGVMSTPKAGGTKPLATFKSGSVNTVGMSNHGVSLLTLTSGYQLKTTRASMKRLMRFKKGSKTQIAGCTQGSAAANRRSDENDGEAEEEKAPDAKVVVVVVVARKSAAGLIVGSIILTGVLALMVRLGAALMLRWSVGVAVVLVNA